MYDRCEKDCSGDLKSGKQWGDGKQYLLALIHQQDQWLFPSYLFFNTKYLHIIQKAQTGHTVMSSSCSFLTHPTRLQASQLPPVFGVLPKGILHKRTGICMLFYSTHTSGSKLHTPGQLVFIKQIWAHIPHPAAKASPPFNSDTVLLLIRTRNWYTWSHQRSSPVVCNLLSFKQCHSTLPGAHFIITSHVCKLITNSDRLPR